MSSQVGGSWGNVLRGEHAVVRMRSRFDSFPKLGLSGTVLPYGNGRSYGDSCLNPGGTLLQMRSLDRFIRFDRDQGVLSCEAGVLLEKVLDRTVPAGWFLQVVPGTQYVTVGGAIANDVHGKNHHRAGTFGHHVRRFELLRSTGERLICSAAENAELFRATVGGLGLTGVITWAELQLRPVAGPWMDVESVRFANLEEFYELSARSDRTFEYVVAWIDCAVRGKHLGRGVLQRANHSDRASAAAVPYRCRLNVPFTLPCSPLNPLSLRIANEVIYRQHPFGTTRATVHFQKFFFPLDRIRNWNRCYGRRGFFQYQCVIPSATARESVRELLTIMSRSRAGSFLGVLKQFGAAEAAGALSFPMQGVSLAVDFPNQARRTEKLFAQFDVVVSRGGGRLYPAKDARMPHTLFRAGYPQWSNFSTFVDPQCSSGFWRRVGTAQGAQECVQPEWAAEAAGQRAIEMHRSP